VEARCREPRVAILRCPGQDLRFWKPEDVVEHPCPNCGAAVEFWRDDVARACPKCRKRVRNPCFNAGCAEWCKYADKCGAVTASGQAARAAEKPPTTKPRR
jgi:predicted RNA-binding Zn-ribbon protein involved in translation (DUF1610 family)